MSKKNHLLFITFFRSIRIDWKRLFLPAIIDIRADNEFDQKNKKRMNLFFGVLFGLMAILFSLKSFPDIRKMISVFLLIVIVYIGFCSYMQNYSFKKNNSGRKPKYKIASFQELFYEPSTFTTVDRYIKSHYTDNKKMTSSECHCLLNILVNENKVRDKSLDPMITLFRKEYPQLLVSTTNRAITKTTFYKEMESQMKACLFQDSSKK